MGSFCRICQPAPAIRMSKRPAGRADGPPPAISEALRAAIPIAQRATAEPQRRRSKRGCHGGFFAAARCAPGDPNAQRPVPRVRALELAAVVGVFPIRSMLRTSLDPRALRVVKQSRGEESFVRQVTSRPRRLVLRICGWDHTRNAELTNGRGTDPWRNMLIRSTLAAMAVLAASSSAYAQLRIV